LDLDEFNAMLETKEAFVETEKFSATPFGADAPLSPLSRGTKFTERKRSELGG